MGEEDAHIVNEMRSERVNQRCAEAYGGCKKNTRDELPLNRSEANEQCETMWDVSMTCTALGCWAQGDSTPPSGIACLAWPMTNRNKPCHGDPFALHSSCGKPNRNPMKNNQNCGSFCIIPNRGIPLFPETSRMGDSLLLSLTQNNPIIHQIEGHLWMISLLTIVYGEVMAVVKICPSDLHQILAKKNWCLYAAMASKSWGKNLLWNKIAWIWELTQPYLKPKTLRSDIVV